MYIPDPTELLEQSIERQIDMVDNDGKYPCYYCGRRFLIEDMYPVNNRPDTPLQCLRTDCKESD